ncbi:MAG: hypothetical protein Q8Q12_12565 [bacterium]|nr:hypothetical protein [bacterium]
MSILNQQQLNNALEAMREYLSAPVGPQAEPPLLRYKAALRKRRNLIESELCPLIAAYLNDEVALAQFKSRVASINARHKIWAFKGSGQRFFNMLLNVAGDPVECDRELKAALPPPPGEEIASGRIERFVGYVKRVRDQWVGARRSLRQCPKIGSVLFFLSYFWQIQHFPAWPVYYPISVRRMGDLGLWRPSGDLPEDFLTFKHIQEELAAAFTEASGEPFDLVRVEGVLYHTRRPDERASDR